MKRINFEIEGLKYHLLSYTICMHLHYWSSYNKLGQDKHEASYKAIVISFPWEI